MAVLTDDQLVCVYDRNDFLIDRTTNTVIVQLEADAVFTVIKDLAERMALGGPVWLVVESNKIHPKDRD